MRTTQQQRELRKEKWLEADKREVPVIEVGGWQLWTRLARGHQSAKQTLNGLPRRGCYRTQLREIFLSRLERSDERPQVPAVAVSKFCLMTHSESGSPGRLWR